MEYESLSDIIGACLYLCFLNCILKSFFLKICVALVLLATVSAAGLAWWATQAITLAESPLDVTIKPNSNLASVTRQLNQAGVAVQPIGLQVLARVLRLGGKLKAGGYEFEQGITPYALLDKIARGDVNQHVVTVIEGWEFKKMRAAIDAHPALRHDTAGLSNAQLMEKIGATEKHPEGLFFPDTYLFAKGSSDVDLYQRAYRTMQKKLTEAWDARAANLPYKTPYEALTMASIIEKETGQRSERPMIAAVFVNRLRSHMRLQTDPTVIYGMGEAYDGNIRKRDLLTTTAYNTYRIDGLPPTPIALPGRESLAAALQPAESDALYFVARGDGTSQFSHNLDDHNRAVNKYQRGQ